MIGRRSFLMGGLPLAAATAARAVRDPWKVAVIGRTGRGDYGHSLDTVWLDIPDTRIVAVADEHEAGRRAAAERLGKVPAYADYREMLERERPELVSVAPRWIDCHRDMVLACVEAGVRGILLEKPICRDLVEADEMVAACERAGVRVAVAHQTRYSPVMGQVRKILEEGRLGELLEIRMRGKEDSRSGGEDLMVLGSHTMDLLRFLAGHPRWCFARVLVGNRPAGPGDVRDGNEGIGPLAGDTITATYGYDGPLTAHFGSHRARKAPSVRFGLQIQGTLGMLSLSTGTLPAAWLLEEPSGLLFSKGGEWKRITSAGVGVPEPLKDGSARAGNRPIVADLIRCIEEKRTPVCSIHDGRDSLELILAVYASHRKGGPVTLPLADRRHPLRTAA